MRKRVCAAAAAAALLMLSPAYAQNKCVDAKGKITYQQDPCPGSVRAPVQAPAAPAKPAAVAASQGRGQAAALAEQGRCVSDWEAIAAALQRSRDEIKGLRSRGEDSSREEQVGKQYMETSMPRFLSACGKYGFDEVTDEGSVVVNSAAARGLQRRIDEARGAMDAAAAREARKAAAEPKQQQSASIESCPKAARQLSQKRAALAQLSPERRKDEEGAVGDFELAYRKQCSKN